ncbi:hypothetical protein HUO09_10225 [Vibrio sp. Y2-5]|uniref:hypothetical protein n=1 Tax=Vibrio TaxID=662 RepID=UPI0013026CB4|nr:MULTISPECIES: hypothetical protein [Vibrio]MBD0786725.1 hypothetical protein [Vibrio sp. Y2-5]MCG6350533.1 hypothetical protein [Vibrio fluvialis]
MPQPMPNEILEGIKSAFETRYPTRTVTRNWQDRAAYKNEELKPGILTLVYSGESPLGDVYNTRMNFMVIGRIYCGKDADGIDVEDAELNFLKEWRLFCSSSAAGNISIQKVMTSQQQEKPDGWFICECVAGPYDFGGEIDWLPEGPEEVPAEIHVGLSPDIGNEENYFTLSDLEPEENA